MVDGPGVQFGLFGRLLCHSDIVTANGTKQLGRATLAPRGSADDAWLTQHFQQALIKIFERSVGVF